VSGALVRLRRRTRGRGPGHGGAPPRETRCHRV